MLSFSSPSLDLAVSPLLVAPVESHNFLSSFDSSTFYYRVDGDDGDGDDYGDPYYSLLIVSYRKLADRDEILEV